MIKLKLPDFKHPDLLRQALTHRSYANEQRDRPEDNERLEFLGDCILNFLSGEFLYQQFPDRAEGDLTVLRSGLINEEQLAQLAQRLDLGVELLLGKGAEQDEAYDKPSILSSTFEALIGAYFLDCDQDIIPVRNYIQPLFLQAMEQVSLTKLANVKSELQHWAHATQGQNPVYRLISSTGPDHSKEFLVEVCVGDRVQAQGSGRSKQLAEKAAAEAALLKLNQEEKQENFPPYDRSC